MVYSRLTAAADARLRLSVLGCLCVHLPASSHDCHGAGLTDATLHPALMRAPFVNLSDELRGDGQTADEAVCDLYNRIAGLSRFNRYYLCRRSHRGEVTFHDLSETGEIIQLRRWPYSDPCFVGSLPGVRLHGISPRVRP